MHMDRSKWAFSRFSADSRLAKELQRQRHQRNALPTPASISLRTAALHGTSTGKQVLTCMDTSVRRFGGIFEPDSAV